jgi:uncharacterized membrane protein YeaQ/YmgE (transglycosylase-associated protein family)
MNLILWIIFGAIAGWLASILMGRNAQMGALANIIVGIIGALIGGFVMNAFGAQGVTGFNLTSLIVAILGAIVPLFLIGLFRGDNVQKSTRSAQEIQYSDPQRIQPKIEKQSPPKPSASQSVSASPKIQPKIEYQSPPKPSASKTEIGTIFISYRRTDSAHVAGRIYDKLVESLGRASVFKDVDSIPLGVDFKEYLDEKVSECNVLLAIIGDRWLDARDTSGRSRLHDPNDFVRIEIESALVRDIRVIPLLVSGAGMPLKDQLPASLRKLVTRNGIEIRPDPDFHRDMERLISHLRNIPLKG